MMGLAGRVVNIYQEILFIYYYYYLFRYISFIYIYQESLQPHFTAQNPANASNLILKKPKPI